ncbi:PAS domain-containing protein [Primorskyibacter marinus]|uniref:PAS domain-containing protein n=1 Tax=Primorskyibacter marinus TaxID=1977320 RepID=UPI0013007948|nr:PAS domain-containing protein [Primorskyibacter marinus]
MSGVFAVFSRKKTAKNVISIQPYQEKNQTSALRLVDAYWHGLRHDHPIPARSEVDPRGLQGALDVSFIVERIGKGLARLRVAGAHLSDLMGMEVAGMPLSALFVPESRESLASALEKAFADPAILRLELRAEAGIGRPALTGKLVLYPLRSHTGEVDRAMGVLVTEGKIGRLPCRMEIVGVRVETLNLVGVCRVDLRPGRQTDAPSNVPRKRNMAPVQPQPIRNNVNATGPGFAERAAPFGDKPALRLVRTDEY